MINTNQLRETTFSKLAHEYPHLEDIQLNIPYALTINPSFQHHSFIESYCAHQQILSDTLKGNSTFKLRPEISTKSTRLHYHGTITFHSHKHLVAFYFHQIPKLKDNSTFSIKPIQDYEWYLYCIKQRHHMKPYLAYTNLPYKITNKTLQLIASSNALDIKSYDKTPLSLNDPKRHKITF
jgi:uncharacterized protein YvpB